MKINDTQPPANDSQVSSGDSDSTQNSDNTDPSPFSRVLTKKRESDQQGSLSQGGKRFAGDLDPSMLGLMPPQPQAFGGLVQPAALESKHAVALPAELQPLVHEITHEVNAAGNQQVSIELNSNVLKGLHIRIERQQGAVSIQFQSTSDQVTSLVSNNIDALSEGLADRGVNVSNIRVSGPGESGRSQNYKGRPNSGGRGQGGQQGRGR